MRSRFLALMVSIGAVLIGCQTSATPTPIPTATDDLAALAQAATPIPTAIVASDTPTPPPPTATATAAPTELPVTATITPTQVISATPTPETLAPTRVDHYLLQRPIPQEGDNIYWLDATYPYGSTQFGAREVHLGVEFVNSRFTPVIAAADGTVIFAGQDDSVMFGPRLGYYGNLVVIEHSFPAMPQPVYTLYAHLQDIAVQTGDTIAAAGERVGRVGDTGIAVGPHLHFEVRVGDAQDYRSTRNPALWLQPYPDSGTLAGRLTATTDAANAVILVRNNQRTREITTYAGERVNSDPAWDENFALPDLPAGQYEVIVSDENGRSLFRESVSIQAGATTFLDIALGDANPRYAVPSATPTATATP